VIASDEGKDKVLLVHRPSYKDWSLPKGKLNPDEYLPAAAVRETVEESAVTVRLGIPVSMVSYPVNGGLKSVYYWRASVLTQGVHTPNAEIDDTAWLPIPKALATMTYPDERALVEQAVALPESTPLLIVRHGSAMDRKYWTGRDQLRQLSSRGRRQSAQLIPLLSAYDVQELASSTSTRCMTTLQPYAKARRMDVKGWATLSEEQAKDNPGAVTTLMKRLLKQTAESGVPMAICGHRPVIPSMLESLGIPARPMQTAAAVVAHLNPAGKTLAVEWHKPRS
jgi:8-oxo-dGTP diphosphatase